MAISLVRVVASGKGWCDDPLCGACPLAVDGCVEKLGYERPGFFSSVSGKILNFFNKK